MDIYHGWFNLKEGISDAEFTRSLANYMGYLKDNRRIADWRLTRRKLGLGPGFLPEFHIMIEVNGLAQLDQAFLDVSSRSGTVEELHHAVNSKVKDVFFALYRDFPDESRRYGEERF